MRLTISLVLAAVLGGVGAPAAPPVGTATELGLQGSAKVLCSAVFVSGREPDEFVANSGFWFMPAGEAEKVTWTVDRGRKAVTTTVGAISRSARFYGDQGCIIDRPGASGVAFTPVPVRTALPDAMTQDWPMGDRIPPAAGGGLPADRVQAALDAAFADPEARTAGMVIVHKGRSSASATGPASPRRRSSKAGRWARASPPPCSPCWCKRRHLHARAAGAGARMAGAGRPARRRFAPSTCCA